MTREKALGDADILCRPLEEVRQLQDRLITEIVDLCYRGTAHYRQIMDRADLVPSDISSINALEQLPITTKEDFLADPEAFRIQLEDLPVAEQTLWEVVYTTGTTSGRPAPVYTTTSDYHAFLHLARRRVGLFGIGDDDSIASVFPLTQYPTGAYLRAFGEVAALGIPIIVTHPGRSEGRWDVRRSIDDVIGGIERHRPTIVWGIASFVRRLLSQAVSNGADFRSVRMCMITGEATSPAMRTDMVRLMESLGSERPRVLNRYGSTEGGISMVECADGSGFHNPAPDHIFHEVVDPISGTRVPDGIEGMLLLSHLMRRGSVFLRYAVGDTVSLSFERCPRCGRTGSERITSQPVRSRDIVKIKGTLVNVAAVQELLESHPGIDEYRIEVRKPSDDPHGLDEFVLQLARRHGADPSQLDHDVTEAVIRLTNLRPIIEYASVEEIYDPLARAKAERFRDRRPSG